MTPLIRYFAVLCSCTIAAFGAPIDGYFDSHGVRIHFIEAGRGEPLVLVHGRGDSVQNWVENGVFDALAKDFRVVAIDCRGHGKSGKPRDPQQYGREMGLDVIRLLDHLSIPRAHVVTYSMGAVITSQILLTHGDRFLSATLGGAAARFEWTDTESHLYRTAAIETERYGFSPATRLFTAAPGTPKMTAEEIEKESAKWLANPDHDRFAMAALMRSFQQQVVSLDQLARVPTPMLGIVGDRDPLASQLKKLKAARPEMKLILIEGGTHTGPRDARKSPEFVAGVQDFIAQHRPLKQQP